MKKYFTVGGNGRITSCVEAASLEEAELNDTLQDTRTIVCIGKEDLRFIAEQLRNYHEVYYDFEPALEVFSTIARNKLKSGFTLSSGDGDSLLPTKDNVQVEKYLKMVKDDFENEEDGYSADFYAMDKNGETECSVWLEKYIRVFGDSDSIIFVVSIV